MAVVGFDITARQSYEGRFKRPYERVDGIVTYAVDPSHWANAGIVDLELAPTDDDGLVRFEGDVTLLRPLDGGRRTGIVEVPNRGRRTLLSLYNRAAPVMEPTAEIDPGDGFLLDQGFTIAWCGWQWDVPRSPERMGLAAPIAAVEAELQLRFQLPVNRSQVTLTDQHTGPLGNHQPIPTRDVDDQDAHLLVRDGIYGDPETIPRSSWRFVDETTVTLDGDFEAGRIYDLIYRAPQSPVAGAGLLAVRDLGRYLRATEDLDHVLGTGQSQCGRFLRTFLHVGCNAAEDGEAAFDGLLIHIAGARRGEFNHRLAQPSVQPTPSFGHLFPFADEPQADPHENGAGEKQVAGLLDRQHARGALPRIIYTNTASEYWRGDASLAHTSAADGSDIDPPTGTRHYLLSSAQHGPGMLPLLDESLLGAKGGNTFNVVDFRPLLRAAIMNLAAWVEEGVEPPPNAVPSTNDGTATTRVDVLQALAENRGDLPPLTLPTNDGLAAIRPLDLGEASAKGIGTYPAQVTGSPYPSLVSAINEDGNEIAGIPMPDVSVPVGTHTGWNPRRHDAGAPEQLLDYVGSSVPFTPAQIEARYGDEAAYLELIEQAADKLVLQGFLLPEDVDVCCEIAAERFRAFIKPD